MSKGLEINILDMVDPGVAVIDAGLQQKTNQLIKRYYGMSNGVGQMQTDVSELASFGDVKVLRIWSHGFPGGQGVSTGPRDDRLSPKGHRAGFSLSTLNEVDGDLAKLAPYFSSGGRVELRGCSVGVGDDGEKFLKALARLFRADVYAAWNPQPIGPLNWSGPVLKASRSGDVRSGTGPSIN